MTDPIPLSLLSLDHPEPPTGWSVFLAGLDIPTELDDIGRWCISRAAARELLAEQREQREASDRKRAEAERQAVERDQAFRAQLADGIPADAVPEGMTAAMLMMAADPMGQGSRRESVLEHALAHKDGAIVYHPIRDEP